VQRQSAALPTEGDDLRPQLYHGRTLPDSGPALPAERHREDPPATSASVAWRNFVRRIIRVGAWGRLWHELVVPALHTVRPMLREFLPCGRWLPTGQS